MAFLDGVSAHDGHPHEADTRPRIKISFSEHRPRDDSFGRRRVVTREPAKFGIGTTTIRVTPFFADPNTHPYDEINGETRTAAVKNHKTGEFLFKQEGVHFPEHFSQNATNIVASKYFYGDQDKGNGSPADGLREFSLQQLIDRVVWTITAAGIDQGLLGEESAENFAPELTWLLVNQYGAFNSPVWFNVGLGQVYGLSDDKKDVWGWVGDADRPFQDEFGMPAGITAVDPYERPQASACFIIGLEDSIKGIWELMQESARLFKYGSGVGSDWSVLRSTKDKLTGGGMPSGPVSFMQVQDSTGGTIQSGGGINCTALNVGETLPAETDALSTSDHSLTTTAFCRATGDACPATDSSGNG